jgi:hypothetical protein
MKDCRTDFLPAVGGDRLPFISEARIQPA